MAEMRFQNGPLTLSVIHGTPVILQVLNADETSIRRNGFLPKYCPECYLMTPKGLTYSGLAKNNLPFSMYRPLDDVYLGYDGWNGLIYLSLSRIQDNGRTGSPETAVGYDFVFKGAAGDLFQNLSDIDAVKEMTDSIREAGVTRFYVAVTKQNGTYHVVIGRKRGQKDAERDIRAKNMRDFLSHVREIFYTIRQELTRPFQKQRE